MSKIEAGPKVKPRIYVLDTNVPMHDPSSIFRFEEHHVYIPRQVLRELDRNKQGNSEVARNSRSASRILDNLSIDETSEISKGLSLEKASEGSATGRVFFQSTCNSKATEPDDIILDAVQELIKDRPEHEVILVSKDINMRITGRARGIAVQDYNSDKVEVEDSDLLHTGSTILPEDFWEKHGKNLKSFIKGGQTHYEVFGPGISVLDVNSFVRLPGPETVNARVIKKSVNSVTFRTIPDYSHEKNSVRGLVARNDEQAYVLDLLLDRDVHIVTLLGKAGVGKTLLALAAGLKQVVDEQFYSDIIFTRVTMPMGEDIGFLPGTEEDKMNPWMGALEDNLDVLLSKNNEGGDWGVQATRDLVRSRIKVKSLNFMRGRTFHAKYLIVDEAQNLTPKQMKALVTRAGMGTKVVCMGNLGQIDTPYLGEGSSGLAVLVDRFKGWENSGHVTLLSGVRSPLANHANEVL